MREIPELMACEGCDAVYRRAPLHAGEVARCPRCSTELDRDWSSRAQRILPLALACLILFAIAHLFSIVEIEVQGQRARTTLVGAVIALSSGGMYPVALMVVATTLLFPLMQLCILCYLLVPLASARRPLGFRMLVRAMQSLRPWGMIEVFLLGVLVTIVKLLAIARVIPGPALWAFVGLTVLLTAVLSFDPGAFWRLAFQPVPQDRAR